MKLLTFLPDEITLPGGTVLKPVIGRTLNQKPFVCEPAAATDNAIIAEAKRRKLKYRVVGVLSRNLRGKLDLHHQPYRPSEWVFVEVKP